MATITLFELCSRVREAVRLRHENNYKMIEMRVDKVKAYTKSEKGKSLVNLILESEVFKSTSVHFSTIIVYEFLDTEVAGKLKRPDEAPYIVLYHDSKSLTNIADLNDVSKLIAVIDVNLPNDLIELQIEKQMQGIGHQDLVKIGDSLNALIRSSVTELQRVRKIHDQIVPLRESDLKGIHLSAKFGAGEAPGGEFFDYIKVGNDIFFVSSSTNSYVVTSLVLNNFERLKNVKELSLDNFIISLHKDLKGSGFDLAKGSKDGLELLIFRIDLKKLKMEGHLFGGFRIFKNSKILYLGREIPFDTEFIEQSKIAVDLNRGDKLVVTSPGVTRNCHNLISGMPFNDFIVDNFNKKARDLLSEIFYQLKKDGESDFLDYDSSAVILEVDNHVMFETH